MNKKQQAIESMRQLVAGKVQSFPATIKAVDHNDGSCEVDTIAGLTFYNVRLRSNIGGDQGGMIVYPAVGSPVIVGRIGNSNQLYVIKYGAADYFTLKTQNESLKQILSDMIDAINQITVPTGTGPSGVPINATAFTAIKERLNKLLKA